MNRLSGYIFADEITQGLRVVPPGRTRPVEVLYQLSDVAHADYFEFACRSGNGLLASRLHRSEQVRVIGGGS